MKVYWTTMRHMYWWSPTWSRPWERARGSFVSSVMIQILSFFWFSGFGSLWSLLWFSWKSGMGVCCMLTTLQQLWVLNWVFNSSVCIRSQDVTLTCVLPFQKWKAHSTQLQQVDFPELYSVIGEETATHLMRTGQNFFAALYGQPNYALQYKYSPVYDLY